MKETLSIFITVIIFVLLIVIFPLYNYFERQDDMSYNLVLKATTSFVDEVINCGYIDQEMYTDYIFEISSTGNLYDIQLEGHKKVLVKSDNSSEYEEQYVVDYNADIFSDQVTNSSNLNDKIIKNGVYHLDVGDKIYIKVVNSSTTTAEALINSIVPNSTQKNIRINYGGIVQNNTWKQAETPLFEEYGIKLSFNLNCGTDNNATYNSDTLKNGITNEIYTGSKYTTITIPNVSPTRPNCTFKGWATDKNATVVEYRPNDKIKIDTSKVLYAVWGYNNITLTLNGNGGTPETTTRTLTYGSKYTPLAVSSINPTKTGYTFAGWYTEATNGTQITSNNDVTSTSNITLYAHWTANKMTVTLETNGGTVTPTSFVVTYNQSYGTLPTPTKTGHTFDGWYLESNFTNKVTSTSIVNQTGNHTLYAKWTANKYTVTFNGNGSTNNATYTISYGSAVGTLPSATRSGYTLLGWFTSATGGTQITKDTKIYGNVTYYAHWQINQSTLTVVPNGGNINGNTSNFTVTKSPNSTYELSVNSYPNAYTVTYNGNGGTSPSSATTKRNTVSWTRTGGGSLSKSTFTFGTTNATITASYSGSTSVTLPSTSRTDTKYCTYTFNGWYTAASNGTYKGSANSSYTPSANITLYAYWSTTYKTATLDTDAFKNYLNIHNEANKLDSTIIGYAARNATCIVTNYSNGYYYTPSIYDSENGKYVSGWIHESGVTVK